jgi:hypothetical protein
MVSGGFRTSMEIGQPGNSFRGKDVQRGTHEAVILGHDSRKDSAKLSLRMKVTGA